MYCCAYSAIGSLPLRCLSVEEILNCGRGTLVGKDVPVIKVNSCVPRCQVYPIFCRTPLKYPLKTFDLCAGMVVVSNARLF